jgi:hypothetical protein
MGGFDCAASGAQSATKRKPDNIAIPNVRMQTSHSIVIWASQECQMPAKGNPGRLT